MSNTHGGKRPNSGRKPRQTPKVPFTVHLEPADAKAFKAICKRNGLSQSEQVAAWVRDSEK